MGLSPWETAWQKVKHRVSYDPAIPLLGIYPKRTENI
jgi:hypothetical protein